MYQRYILHNALIENLNEVNEIIGIQKLNYLIKFGINFI